MFIENEDIDDYRIIEVDMKPIYSNDRYTLDTYPTQKYDQVIKYHNNTLIFTILSNKISDNILISDLRL